jgi:hypothetical protein
VISAWTKVFRNGEKYFDESFPNAENEEEIPEEPSNGETTESSEFIP